MSSFLVNNDCNNPDVSNLPETNNSTTFNCKSLKELAVESLASCAADCLESNNPSCNKKETWKENN